MRALDSSRQDLCASAQIGRQYRSGLRDPSRGRTVTEKVRTVEREGLERSYLLRGKPVIDPACEFDGIDRSERWLDE